MSTEKKTFFDRLISKVIDLFKSKFKVWVAERWEEVVDELKPELIDLIKIVDQIKEYADSPVLDAIVNISSTNLDNDGLLWLRKTLNMISVGLRIDKMKVKDLTSTDYGNLSAKLIQAHTGMSEGQAKITSEVAYQNS